MNLINQIHASNNRKKDTSKGQCLKCNACYLSLHQCYIFYYTS